MFSLLAKVFAGSFFKTVGGAIKSGGHWLFSSATHVLAALLLIALLFGLWERHQYHVTQSDLAACSAGRKADQASWALQVKNARAATALAKQKGKDTSNDAEAYHTRLQADNHGLRDYIAANRVHPAARAPATPGASGGDHTLIYAETSALPTVAVPDSVINTCDADYTYAASAYELGQRLIQQGLAEPQK